MENKGAEQRKSLFEYSAAAAVAVVKEIAQL